MDNSSETWTQIISILINKTIDLIFKEINQIIYKIRNDYKKRINNDKKILLDFFNELPIEERDFWINHDMTVPFKQSHIIILYGIVDKYDIKHVEFVLHNNKSKKLLSKLIMSIIKFNDVLSIYTFPFPIKCQKNSYAYGDISLGMEPSWKTVNPQKYIEAEKSLESAKYLFVDLYNQLLIFAQKSGYVEYNK